MNLHQPKLVGWYRQVGKNSLQPNRVNVCEEPVYRTHRIVTLQKVKGFREKLREGWRKRQKCWSK